MNYTRMAECRGLAPLARRHTLVSTEARSARPVDIPNWSAWGDLHSQGCSILSRTGLLFPLKPVAAKLVGMKGIAPPRLPDSESGPSAIRVKPHAHRNWHSRKDSHPHLRRSKRRALVIELREHLKLVGRHGFAPCSRRVRAGTSLSKFAAQTATRRRS